MAQVLRHVRLLLIILHLPAAAKHNSESWNSALHHIRASSGQVQITPATQSTYYFRKLGTVESSRTFIHLHTFLNLTTLRSDLDYPCYTFHKVRKYTQLRGPYQYNKQSIYH